MFLLQKAHLPSTYVVLKRKIAQKLKISHFRIWSLLTTVGSYFLFRYEHAIPKGSKLKGQSLYKVKMPFPFVKCNFSFTRKTGKHFSTFFSPVYAPHEDLYFFISSFPISETFSWAQELCKFSNFAILSF